MAKQILGKVTPTRGVDYWTEQDKQEVIRDAESTMAEELTKYSLITETGSTIDLSIDDETYVMTLKLKDKNGNELSDESIDLPLETMVVNASYDNTAKEITLTLKNGNETSFSVADLVSGLVSEDTLNTTLADYYDKDEIDEMLEDVGGETPIINLQYNMSQDEKTEVWNQLVEYKRQGLNPVIHYYPYGIGQNNAFYELYNEKTEVPSETGYYSYFFKTSMTSSTVPTYFSDSMRISVNRYTQAYWTFSISRYENGSIWFEPPSLLESGNFSGIEVPLLRLDNETEFTPTGDYNPATKKYVDDAVAEAVSGALEEEY